MTTTSSTSQYIRLWGFVTLISFIRTLALAEPLPHAYCEIKTQGIVKRVRAPQQPNFFFRVLSDQLVVSYAASNGNRLFNLDTQNEISIPGGVDPVPMGEHFITIPEDFLKIYSLDALLQNKKQPVLITSDLQGVYQSVGLREKTREYEIYGVITAQAPLQYQEFKVSQTPQGEWQIAKHSNMRKLCGNIDIKLPMLSKDTREVSGYDGQAGTTKIWSIQHETGNCTEVVDLGVTAGKADFSYDGRRLAFHLNSDPFMDTEWFSEPSEDANYNIHIYDRVTKKITRVTQNYPGENAYYPVFRKDGTLVYAEVDLEAQPWFVQINPKLVRKPAVDFKKLKNSDRVQQIMALAKLWNASCFSTDALKIVEAAITAGLSLDPQKCEQMVENDWLNLREHVGHASVTALPGSHVVYDDTKIPLFSKEDLIGRCRDLSL